VSPVNKPTAHDLFFHFIYPSLTPMIVTAVEVTSIYLIVPSWYFYARRVRQGKVDLGDEGSDNPHNGFFTWISLALVLVPFITACWLFHAVQGVNCSDEPTHTICKVGWWYMMGSAWYQTPAL
jgi:hypothetical protein